MNFQPILIFTDESDNEVTDKYFEAVRRGNSSNIHVLKLVNKGDKCDNIVIKTIQSNYLFGKRDTVDSTFLSLNLKDFSNEIKVSLDNDESILFYLKWQPPYNANLGNMEWGLMATVDVDQVEKLTC